MDQRGYIITNKHVINVPIRLSSLQDGRVFEALLVETRFAYRRRVLKDQRHWRAALPSRLIRSVHRILATSYFIGSPYNLGQTIARESSAQRSYRPEPDGATKFFSDRRLS